MYVAKAARTGVEVYDSDKDDHSPERLRLASELRRAIEAEQLTVHYQPQIHAATGHVRILEALVRWQHPQRGLVSPETFLPIAEHTGLMRALTRSVLELSLRQCRKWHETGRILGVAVNVSERDLLDLQFPNEVESALRRCQVEPHWLELEITENTILVDPVRTRAILNRLKGVGVRIAIDDFGSGASSLGHLRSLPLDVLKIDRSFVRNMQVDPDDTVIVRSTIDLAHNLGLEVVAEGVEDEATVTQLVALGCDALQGFHYSRPLPADEVGRWLASRGYGDGSAAVDDDALRRERPAA